MWPDVLQKCHKCNHQMKLSQLKKHSYTEPRQIFGDDDIVFAYFRIYNCKNCDGKINSNRGYFLSTLPFYCQRAFPFLLSKKKGILETTFLRFLSSMECSVGIAGFRNQLREGMWNFKKAYKLKFQKDELAYYTVLSSLKSFQANPRDLQSFCGYRMESNMNQIARFSTFEDTNGYFGHVPSEKFLHTMLEKHFDRMEPYLRKEMQRRNGTSLFMDHSFKYTKHILCVGWLCHTPENFQ